MDAEIEQRLNFAVDLARRAGDLGLSFFRVLGDLKIESKGHQDLVSNADREVELFIRAALQEAFPDDGIVGEEHELVEGSSKYVWIIDPIDGTANFVRGVPAWCVVIALTTDGVAMAGVVHEPSHGETFSAGRGGGAFLNGKPIQVSSATSLTEGSVGTGFSNRVDARNVAVLIEKLLAEGGVFFRNASGALMLAYVAAGRLLGYCEEHMNSWDCLAGLLLVEEAGGVIEPPDPATAVHKGTMVIAGGRGVFDQLRGLCEHAFNKR
jgi:myo-inositol-1(or 4)-monophosphatase